MGYSPCGHEESDMTERLHDDTMFQERNEAGVVKIWSAVDSASAAAAKSLQSRPTLCNPTDSSPPGSSIHRIL